MWLYLRGVSCQEFARLLVLAPVVAISLPALEVVSRFVLDFWSQ